MWNVIGLWRFPEHDKVNPEEVNLDEYSKNIVPFDKLLFDKVFEKDIYKFQWRVSDIIESIVKSWVQDYINTLKKSTSYDYDMLIESIEVEEKWSEMIIKAHVIDGSLVYVWWDMDVAFREEYILKAIEDILSVYRIEIFEMLLWMDKESVNN